MVNPVTSANPPDPTVLGAGDYTSAIILNKIFSELSGMIGTLQNAAAAQANRLTFLSSWQQDYTDAMAQIHTFQKGDGTAFGGSDSTSVSQRGTLNTFNSNLLQSMQNRQSIVSNVAKSLQSNVNQSNDAVNAQSNLGTAILQELGTLLGSIFN